MKTNFFISSLVCAMLFLDLALVTNTAQAVSNTGEMVTEQQINEKPILKDLQKKLKEIVGESQTLSANQRSLVSELIFQLAFNRHTQFAWDKIGWGEISTAGPDGMIKEEGYQWFQTINKSKKKITVKNWGYLLNYTKLEAYYINNNSNKTVIIQHGYRGPVTGVAAYAKMFYDMGYNVLIPEARGTGNSEGLYINFGWREKDDIIQWIKTLSSNHEVLLMGESMGAATMMMASGEKLPTNVKAIIEDCGYTSLEQQLEYLFNLANSLVGHILPTNILDNVYEEVEKKLRFNVKDASAINQVAKSTLPMLFIHGDRDSFVNTNFVYDLYAAKTKGYRDMMVVKGADHTQSISFGYEQYKQKVVDFLTHAK